MVEIYDFEAAKARLRVKRAERSLDRANELLNDENPGVCLSLALCGRIRSEQRRVDEAQQRLVKLNRPLN
jgi:predicted Zn-dependent protease